MVKSLLDFPESDTESMRYSKGITIRNEEIKKALLHDAHKISKRKHTSDNKLSSNADKNAASMSRIHKKGDKMTDDVLRRSFVFELPISEKARKTYERRYKKQYTDINNISTKELYRKVLNDDIMNKFNEISTMKQTSLKYHSLLTSVLHYNYLKGNLIEQLYLNIVREPDDIYTVVFNYNDIYFTISPIKEGSRIGKPSPHFGSCISRIHPEARSVIPHKFIFDNLSRIGSWSIGLQYLEDILKYIDYIGGDVCRPL